MKRVRTAFMELNTETALNSPEHILMLSLATEKNDSVFF